MIQNKGNKYYYWKFILNSKWLNSIRHFCEMREEAFFQILSKKLAKSVALQTKYLAVFKVLSGILSILGSVFECRSGEFFFSPIHSRWNKYDANTKIIAFKLAVLEPMFEIALPFATRETWLLLLAVDEYILVNLKA